MEQGVRSMDALFISEPDFLGEAFKQGMRRLASTVAIITLLDEKAQPWGMTATSVTSLSAEPVSLLVCVNRNARMHGLLSLGTAFCVNLLSEGHSELSSAFGGQLPQKERFALGAWEQLGQIAFLSDAQVNFSCCVDAIFNYGTHSIVVGKIAGIRVPGDFAPLIYGNGGFLQSRAP